jgi:NADH-quinone oxidoreductase subunit G
MVLLAEANSFGAALLAGDADFEQLLGGMADGRIKALLCLEADPLSDCPDRQRLIEGLERLELLAVLDYLPTATAEKADLLLPTTTFAEGEGTLVNNEGRMQPFAKVFDPGEPLRISTQGGHPPRTFSATTPGALPCQAWAVLAELCTCPVDLQQIRRDLEAEDPRFSGLSGITAAGSGLRVQAGKPLAPPPATAPPLSGDGLQLLACQTLYGSEILSSHSAPLAAVRPQPFVLLHQQDADRFGIAAGDPVLLSTDQDQLTLPARISDRMAAGLVIVPRLQGSELECFYFGQAPQPCRIEKVSAT